MKLFSKALREIKAMLTYMLLFDIIINSIVIFLIFYLLFLLLGITPVYAAGSIPPYFIISFLIKSRKRKVVEVENKYGFLKEKLRTAEDNLYLQSPIADDLEKEILTDLKKVESSAFFNQKSLFIKIPAIIVLCFLIINVHPLNLNGIKILMPEIKPSINLDFSGTTSFYGTKLVSSGKKQPAPVQMVEVNDNIYGDSAVAGLGGEELVIQLRSADDQPRLRNEDAMNEKPEELFPDAESVSAEAFKENIPKEQQELVKNYFKSVVED